MKNSGSANKGTMASVEVKNTKFSHLVKQTSDSVNKQSSVYYGVLGGTILSCL